MKGVLVLFVLTVTAAAQVHIRVNVVITPVQIKPGKDAGTNPHFFLFDIVASTAQTCRVEVVAGPDSLDGAIFDAPGPGPCKIYINSPPAGGYNFWIETCSPLRNHSDSIRFKIYLDATLIYDMPYRGVDFNDYDPCFTFYGLEIINGLYVTPYYSKFNFAVSPRGIENLNAAGMVVTGYDDDSRTAWSPDDQMTLTMTSGSEYASFYSGGTREGTVVNTTGSSLGSYTIVADVMTPASSGTWVVVQAESDGLTQVDSVEIFPAANHFDVYLVPDSIIHEYSSTIYIQPVDREGNEISIPENTLLQITADDNGKYGELEKWGSPGQSFTYGDALNGSIYYKADGEEAEGYQTVVVHVSESANPSDSGSAALYVRGDMVVRIIPRNIAQGDTAQITVKKVLDNGKTVDFSPSDIFDIGIVEGRAYGTILLSGGDTGGYFSSVSQPFRFIADTGIDLTKAKVGIEVAWEQPRPTSIRPVVKNDSISAVVEKSVHGDNNLRSFSRMPVEVATSNVKSADSLKVVSSTRSSEKASDEDETYTDTYGIGYGTIEGAAELEVMYPKDDQKISGDDLPKMPDVSTKIKAKLHSPNNVAVTYNWEIRIKWAGNGNWTTPRNDEKYSGQATGQTNKWTDLNVKLDQYIRGGQTVTLKVDATTAEDAATKSFDKTFAMKGTNPSKAALYAALGEDILAAVAWQESTFRQFSSSPGYPLQGGDLNDFGVMGIRNPANDDLIWSWLANVNYGKNYFINACMARAANYHTRRVFSRFDPPPTPLSNDVNSTDKNQNQVFPQAYCYYNAGPYSGVMYWQWIPPVVNAQGITVTPGLWKKNVDEQHLAAISNANSVWHWFISKPWNK